MSLLSDGDSSNSSESAAASLMFGSHTVAPNSPTPYTDATQTRKNSPTHIKRPMNAFMVFSHHERRKVITEDPRLENTQISKELGRRWKQLSEEERVPYIREADKLRQYHQREYPDYKYKPIKKKTVRMKYPSEENTTATGGKVAGMFGKDMIKMTKGGPLRQLDPNRPINKININSLLTLNSSSRPRHKRSLVRLEPPGSAPPPAPPPSALSPPAKVPYSPHLGPATPDQAHPFYGEPGLAAHPLLSPHCSRLVPLSPMTRSCPVTPLSRPHPHQAPHTPDHQHPGVAAQPPSPLFSRAGGHEAAAEDTAASFPWELDSASLPDLTSFLDNFLPSSAGLANTELSLDVGDLKLDFTPDTEEVAGAGAGDNMDMNDINDIGPEDLLDDNLIDLQLMEFVS